MEITDYLAIYAAILSTAVFIRELLQSRPKIKIDMIFGLDTDTATPQAGVYIVVRNVSSHVVHLAAMDIMYRHEAPSMNRRLKHWWRYKSYSRLGWVYSNLSNYEIDAGCPVSLEARTSHEVFIPACTVERMFADGIERSLVACVQDRLWNNFYSRKFTHATPLADI